MCDLFRVNCPGCGKEMNPITTHPGTVGIHCSCGVSVTADISAQEIDECGSERTDLPGVDTYVYSSRRVEYGMSREPPDADITSDEELTELLADAEGTTPEEIDRGAAELEIAPPEAAIVVNIDE